MEYIETEIQGVYIIKPKVFFDARGYQDTAFSVVYITRRASIRKPSW